MKLSRYVSRLSASQIGESQLHIIDTEGGKRLTQFCAISFPRPLEESECLNLYNTQAVRGKVRKRNSSGEQYGNWLPFGQMLDSITGYFRGPTKGFVLIGHSAISADSSHLTSSLLGAYQQRRERSNGRILRHSCIVGYIDTLPLFRGLYPHLASYKQQDLVRYFLGVRYNAHNALDDSLMLFSLWSKYLWPITKDNLEVLSRASVSNLYCVDRYLIKSGKKRGDEFAHWNATNTVASGTKPIRLYPTRRIFASLYPTLNKII